MYIMFTASMFFICIFLLFLSMFLVSKYCINQRFSCTYLSTICVRGAYKSIHPSIFYNISSAWSSGGSLTREAQTSYSPAPPLTAHLGEFSGEPLQHALGLPWSLLLIAINTSTKMCPRGILVRCLSRLRLFNCSMSRSSGSPISTSEMTELLTVSLRESPATLWRELISATCIHSLTLLVTTQSSWQ